MKFLHLLHVLLAFSVLMTPGKSGENITYDGTAPSLQPAPGYAGGSANSLFPSSSVSENTVTIDYAAGTDPYRVFGGVSENASAFGNTVFLQQGTVGDRLFGALTSTGTVSDNKAVITGGTVIDRVYGASSTDGDAFNNSVEISGASTEVGINVLGAYSGTGEVSGNSVTMSGGWVKGGIWGAQNNGVKNASNNTVTMLGGTVDQRLYGAQTIDGDAFNNSVEISGASTVIGINVLGAYARTGEASGNNVTMSGGLVNNSIWGAQNNGIKAAFRNTVTLSGGVVGYRIFGAQTSSGAASDNKVIITGGTVADRVYGASSTDGDAFNNSVEISGASTELGWNVLGAYTNTGEASGNSVTMSGGWVKGNIWGAESDGSKDASDNKVTILGGTVGIAGDDTTGNIYGGMNYGTGNAERNAVSISGASTTVNYDIAAGWATNGDANDNIITVSGGSMRGVVGGYVTTSGNAERNTLLIEGGTFSNALLRGGWTSSGDATGNTVTVQGGSGLSAVIGGQSDGDGAASGNFVNIMGGAFVDNDPNSCIVGGVGTDNSGAMSASINNTVKLSGSPTLANVAIYGGNSSGLADEFSGNKLQVHDYSGTAVKSVANFEFYDFLVPTSLAGGGAALTVIDASDISSSVVTVNFMDGGPVLQAHDRITLVNDAAGLTAANLNTSTQVKHGALLLYDLDLFTDANNLYAGVRSTRAADETKSISEGRAASLAFLNQGQDLIAEKGFDAAEAYLGLTDGGWSNPAFFSAASGGRSRYKTGSHVDVDGVSSLLGLAWRNNTSCGSLLLGTFLETGYVGYDTRNTFASGTVRGNGDSRYFGGGVMARHDWRSGLYVEAAGRVGGIRNEFDSDLTDASGNRAGYAVDSAYFGAHARIGYRWQLNGKASIDLSGKYLWSRQNRDTATVTGFPVRFDANDSHRLRAGIRFTYEINNCIAPYAGAAFEYEFNGRAEAGIRNTRFGVPTLKGGTGIGEVGLALKPSRTLPLSLDLGVQGYAGKREGVTGSLWIGLEF